jgi:arabinofuranosyltransferase
MRERLVGVVVFGVAAAGVALGWWAFWFLCDDAFIAFRYVDHARRGWGYVWNRAPFLPVEGYTSFSWVVLLRAVWWLTGVEPPEASNPIGLLCGVATLAIAAAMVWRLPVSPALARLRVPMLALVLFGIVSNRTFLTWTSSGLETAFVSLWLVAWVAVATTGRPLEDRRHLLALTTFASLLALTRPDGYLYCAATLAVVGLRLRHARSTGSALVADLAVLAPLLAPVVHVVWRRATYGLWLPNTYYAKHVAPWPQAGLPYLGSFLLEYGYWVWVLVGLVVLARAVRRARRADLSQVARAVVVGALAGQVAYYVLLIGGDHFEFRIFHHLVPLLVLSLPWMADHLGLRPSRALAVLALMITIGLPIPWIHWVHTKDLPTREEAKKLRYKVAPHFPAPIRWYASTWDDMQEFLIGRFVCLRHQTHKTFLEFQLQRFPTREEGLRLPTEGWPIFHHISVGLPGWTMPTIAMIDDFGLSDRIIAASPPRHVDPYKRFMAHDRKAPPGYIPCFDPNVQVTDQGKVTIRPRKTPMTDEGIVACETRFLQQAMSHGIETEIDRGDR